MKKLFAVPMFHYTFVLTCVALVMGLMIGVVNAITAPIIEENLRKARVAAYQLVLPDMETFIDVPLVSGDPKSIQSKVIAKDKDDKTIGYIYEAFAENKYGDMRIAISVDGNGKIKGATFISILQTLLKDETEKSLQSVVNANISSFNLFKVAGATGSYNTLQSLLSDVAIAHSLMDIEPSDPLIAWYGEGYELIVDETFTPDAKVLSKNIVKDVDGFEIGYLYKVKGTGQYDTVYEMKEDEITIYIWLDLDGNIMGIHALLEEYKHSTNYYDKAISFIEELIGTNISAFEYDTDLKTGATYSSNLIQELIEALGGNR